MHYMGVADRNPEPLPYDPARAAEIVGGYENDMMTLIFRADEAALTVVCTIKPEICAATGTELPPRSPAGRGWPAAQRRRRVHHYQARRGRAARLLHPRP